MGTITRSFANLITASGPSSVPALGTLTLNNIQFPATAVPSANANNLDDYEEGTWTPVPTFANANAGMVYTSTGDYTKIGRMVILTVAISTNAITKGSAAGDVYISGLPFQSDGLFSNGTILWNTANWAGDIPDGWTIFNGISTAYLYYKSSTTAVTNINPDDMGTGGSANNFAATMIYTTTS